MSLTHWQNWLDDYQTHAGADLYFILNNAADSEPVKLFYDQQWVEEGFALYHETPLSANAMTGPWLIKARPALRYSQFLPPELLLSPDWGWAYRSHQSLSEQLEFWRARLFFDIGGQTQVFRFMDARVMAGLLPAFLREDWRELAYPAVSLIVSPSGTVFTPPTAQHDLPYSPDYRLPDRLYFAWWQTPEALAQLCQKFENQLWEEFPNDAALLSQDLGDLVPFLRTWLKPQLAEHHLKNATTLQAKHYLTQIHRVVMQYDPNPEKEFQSW